MFVSIKSSIKKKIAKNKGLIVKNDYLEIGYSIDSLNFRRRLSIFIVFVKSVSKTNINIK